MSNREARRHAQNGPGLQFLPQQVPQQQQLVVNGGPLMGLDALISLTAATCPGDPASAVDRACEIVAQSLKHVALGTIQKRLAELNAEHNKKAEAAKSPILAE